MRSKYLVVENIDFIGARVPGRNGAGIRFERPRKLIPAAIYWLISQVATGFVATMKNCFPNRRQMIGVRK